MSFKTQSNNFVLISKNIKISRHIKISINLFYFETILRLIILYQKVIAFHFFLKIVFLNLSHLKKLNFVETIVRKRSFHVFYLFLIFRIIFHYFFTRLLRTLQRLNSISIRINHC